VYLYIGIFLVKLVKKYERYLTIQVEDEEDNPAIVAICIWPVLLLLIFIIDVFGSLMIHIIKILKKTLK
jgi:hypothetical protein